ncbi:Ankyrin repeat-containing protein 36 [Elsinoe fawcettii]|nr:Ankyrin repeat-containing protein 36 [Elsinoe fawcettii]
MDPLSVAASVVAVATLAAQVSHAFHKLREDCVELPGRFYALANEVTDLELVLNELVEVVGERQFLDTNDFSSIERLLETATQRLQEMQNILVKLKEIQTRKNVLARASTWRKLQPRFTSLQNEVRDVKGSLNVLLGSSNSRDMLKVRVELETLSAVTTRFSEDDELFRDQVTDSMDTFGNALDQVDTRITRVEDILKEQLAQMETNQIRHMGMLYGLGRAQERKRSTSRSSFSSISSNGSGSSAPAISAEYWFPMGYCWSQIVTFQLAYQPNLGPSFSLSTLRQVPDDAACVSFALKGDITGLRNLFMAGAASPRDVSSTRGYSLLRWALYGQQYETCKFLLQQGADPYYRPISQSDNSPSDKASDVLLRGGLSRRAKEVLRAIADGNDFVEMQNFQPIHKAVLGLTFQDLEEAILEDVSDIDIPDAGGRTALEWAAARGDDRAVTILLSYGADPNIMDKKLNTPLTLAANQNHTPAPKPILTFPPIKFGTPLSCAARNAHDPILLKTLLDFGADPEATGVDGVTPLLHVARNQGAAHAILLLGAGANINAMAKDGRTPLTTAIMYNNHDVLQLLLDRWYEYSECPRLRGPNLLDLAARYADLRTLRILSEASHFRLRCDGSYVLERCMETFRARTDVSDETEEAFVYLLEVLQRAQPEERDVKCDFASLMPGRGRGRHGHDVDDVFESSSDDGDFEDAFEDVHALAEKKEVVVTVTELRRGRTWS